MKTKLQINNECKEIIKVALLGYVEECRLLNADHPNTVRMIDVKTVTKEIFEEVKNV